MNRYPHWLASVHHDGSPAYVSNLYPALGESVRLRLRMSSDAPLRQAYLRIFPDGEQFFRPMERTSSTPPVQWWEVELLINEPVVNYRFVLESDDGVWHLTAAGPVRHIPLDLTDFRILADYVAPEWVHGSVFYQIFPDRFANADPSRDPQPDEFEYRGYRPRTYAWGEAPPEEQPGSITFYGGDLPGIEQHLDYIEALGVNALYLNPVFTAHTSHKYDVIDYEHVDPHFGGDDALMGLGEALHERGMRYLLDIVPNHCGYWHPWFQAARADPEAPEADFFTFTDHPEEYLSWLGVWMLPKLNYRSAELRRRMYGAEDAIFRRWLYPPFSADGWRVDVANMLARQGPTQLGREVVQGIRRAVKETLPDAYLMGENFFDPTPQLQGDQWDAVMNYQGLAKPLLYWLKGVEMGSFQLQGKITSPLPWTTEALIATWQGVRAAIPWAVALQQFNLLNSHDTARLRTVVEGNDALQRLAAVVQFTYPGVPCLYYGDEIGMTDEPHVGPRACMVWDEARWNRELLDFYRDLIRLRRTSPMLMHGGFQVLLVEEDTFAYQREAPEGWIIVVAHRGEGTRSEGRLDVARGGIPDGTLFVEHFSGQKRIVADGALLLPEQPQGVSLWETVN
ncbi:MAG: alpha-amylase family glycosyl hydrolase [Anaerolineales bacterium]